MKLPLLFRDRGFIPIGPGNADGELKSVIRAEGKGGRRDELAQGGMKKKEKKALMGTNGEGVASVAGGASV